MLNEIKNEIKNKYNNSPDLITREINIKNKTIIIIFLESLCDSNSINKYILENITKDKLKNINLIDILTGANVKKINTNKEIYELLSNGYTIIINNDEIIAVETQKKLSRTISEPSVEQTISGPKDSFNEDYITNIGLIRKRIKTNNLVIDEHIIGTKTKTKVGVIYLKDLAEQELIENITKKLKKINIDSIMDSTYIRQLMMPQSKLFPSIETSERPDLACMSLIEGKVCILVENSNSILIIPTFFLDLFHSPEDYYQKPANVSFTRIIRLISFIIAIILPAFYIAITTYNHETIPLTLIVNFASQRDGVPFPAIIEALGMTIVFEILRESDLRMPAMSGTAISILGAIVLGDAAVSAGIVSPIMVIVIAISSICSLMFSHVAMVNTIRIWKITFMLFAAFLGIVGIVFASFIFLIFTTSLKSFGKPYLYPITPLNITQIKDSFIKENIKKIKKDKALIKNEVLK